MGPLHLDSSFSATGSANSLLAGDGYGSAAAEERFDVHLQEARRQQQTSPRDQTAAGEQTGSIDEPSNAAPRDEESEEPAEGSVDESGSQEPVESAANQHRSQETGPPAESAMVAAEAAVQTPLAYPKPAPKPGEIIQPAVAETAAARKTKQPAAPPAAKLPESATAADAAHAGSIIEVEPTTKMPATRGTKAGVDLAGEVEIDANAILLENQPAADVSATTVPTQNDQPTSNATPPNIAGQPTIEATPDVESASEAARLPSAMGRDKEQHPAQTASGSPGTAAEAPQADGDELIGPGSTDSASTDLAATETTAPRHEPSAPETPPGPSPAVPAEETALAFKGVAAALASRGNHSADSEVAKVDRARFVQRVTRAFHSLSDEGGQIKLRLSPPELGSLKLEVTVSHGVLIAQVEAETPQARNLLLENLAVLRDRLQEQNIKIERFDVDLMNSSEGRLQQGYSSRQEQEERDRRDLPRPRASGSSSEPQRSAAPPLNRAGEGSLNVIV